MKIAVNCMFLLPKAGGIKEYIYNLIYNLNHLDNDNEYIFYVFKDKLKYARENLPPDINLKIIRFKSGNIFNTICRVLFENSFWRKEELNEKFDIFHSPFFYSPNFIKAKTIITVHDMRFIRYPYTYTFLRYVFLKRAVRKSLLNADSIITISQFTKREIIEAYKIPADKIEVIHESINKDLFNEKHSYLVKDEVVNEFKNNRFILTVGHLEPRKNYDRLITCFINLCKRDNNKDLKLVIIGKKGHHYKKTIKRINENPNIVYLDFVDHATLIWFYKNAKLFVFPSLYEGFGFPPLEAASVGTISAVSNKSSIPEVCNDSVIYFDPYNIEEMEKAIELGLYDNSLRDDLRKKSYANLLRFSWENNARETIKMYNHIYNK